MSVNKTFILGRLGKDPEIKYTANSMAVCNFTVATTESWKNNKGEPCERVTWHNIEVWGKVAENCSKYLSKGKQVYIEGSIHTDSYDKDGEKRYFTKIKAKTVQFLSPASNSQQQNNDQSMMSKDFSVQTNAEYTTDDIPF